MKNSPDNGAMSINMLIVYDTDSVLKTDSKPSLIQTEPVTIINSSQYVFCAGAIKIIDGQGTAKLKIIADPASHIKFRGTSISQNSNDSVLIYQIISSKSKKNSPFTPDLVVINQAVQPNPDSEDHDGLPALNVKESFMSFDSKINGSGKRQYLIYFALYRIADDGETQNLYGYYCSQLNMSIIRKGKDTSN